MIGSIWGIKVGQSHETRRQPPLVRVSELIEQLGSLLASETDLVSDTPVEVLVGRQRYAVVGTQAELDDDSRAVVTLLTALKPMLSTTRTGVRMMRHGGSPRRDAGDATRAILPVVLPVRLCSARLG
jgi:hypothetical protein